MRPDSLYETSYFDSLEDAQNALERIASNQQIILLPDYDFLTQIARNLTNDAQKRALTAKDILMIYQLIVESGEHTNAWCLLPNPDDSSGEKICGGAMTIHVDLLGAFYVCLKHPNIHRVPKIN